MPPASASLRGIRVDFPGTRAVDDVDLDIAPGVLTAIVGPNGAGKSTLLEVLAGTRRPTAGRVDVHGHSRAFVPQRAAVSDRLPLTVREMVAVGTWGRRGRLRRSSPTRRAAVDDAMARLDITPLARHPFTSLSGGQRQRALLAQGLARAADLLLLDEPTTGLDAHSGALIRAAIADETRRGTSVVCVSHDDALVACATRLVRLEGGRVRSSRALAP
ncbi:ABC-type Mn/Zn transport systems, ATPase component [Microbacterium testaceum StLB037]|uniref:ABC-type Mn/Zn transport systems, ATPase component n=1 Tax=Microbacterium testaceum (strain StLB037) TaxID=979556 RepID=E8NGP3_MICTS|nr:zinc ABC transporter ATP-binding protein AztA [Microbacterium testaceum]BAJ75342.1 ABC-type Mn/Zn transport systems, ATPase component [Microbacterium testaceum StLB037]